MESVNSFLAKRLFLKTNPSDTSNPRYPSCAANMEDGRNMTLYTSRCENNIECQHQFNTKQWMVENASSLIEESRNHYQKKMCCSAQLANTTPPPAWVSHQTRSTNKILPTGVIGGIGVIRADTKCPPLFGTFENVCDTSKPSIKRIQMTEQYEGGRNTIRSSPFQSKVSTCN